MDAMQATTTTTGVLMLSTLLDMLFLTLGPWAVSRWIWVQQPYEAALVVILLGYLVLALIGGGRSPGMRLMGLAFAYHHEYRLLRFFDYLYYLIESLPSRFKYHGLYETVLFLFDETHQSPPMKEHGLLVVKRSMYRRFLEDYEQDGVIHGSAMDENRPDRTPAVFREHDE
jgi:hypothetical protein